MLHCHMITIMHGALSPGCSGSSRRALRDQPRHSSSKAYRSTQACTDQCLGAGKSTCCATIVGEPVCVCGTVCGGRPECRADTLHWPAIGAKGILAKVGCFCQDASIVHVVGVEQLRL